MVLSKECYLQVMSPFQLYLLFYNDSDHETSMKLKKHIQVYVVNNLACGSLYFWSYSTWKIGFVASRATSQKQVFQVKKS
jgi:hypothetical protein